MIVLNNGLFSTELETVDIAIEEQQLNSKHTVTDKPGKVYKQFLIILSISSFIVVLLPLLLQPATAR